MDTYILRIYRRSTTASEAVHGTLERVGAPERAAFASRDDLWALLVAPANRDHFPFDPPSADEGNP